MRSHHDLHPGLVLLLQPFHYLRMFVDQVLRFGGVLQQIKQAGALEKICPLDNPAAGPPAA